nr:PREDICTED: protein D3-like [Bemisia tabaci]
MTCSKCLFLFGLWALFSHVTGQTGHATTEDDALLVYTPHPNLQNSLREHLIIPDLLKIGPEYVLDLNYGNKSVSFGNKFTPEELENEPTSLHWTCREDAFHTLIVVGLDAPAQKNHTDREWKHWIVGNIPANNITAGETIVPYQGVGFSFENGPHRMVFMVYEQPWQNTIDFSEKILAESPIRPRFDTRKFADKYSIGDPIAANFLICETNWPAPTKLTL